MISARHIQNALARLSGRALPPDMLRPLARAPRARKAPALAPVAAPVAPAPQLTAPAYLVQHLKEHPAPAGDDVPRYSLPDGPAPVWSIAALCRPDGRKFSGGKGPRAGHVLLKDRRKPWQKACLSVSWDRTGGICQYRGKLTDPSEEKE